MADQDYQQKFQRDIIGATMPSLQKQKKGMYDFLLQNALRTGQSATSVAEGLRPYAEASGQAAAKAGVAATSMAQRAQEFDKQQANWQRKFDVGQGQWEKQFERQGEQQNLANLLAIYQETGELTPEMAEAFGMQGRGAVNSPFGRNLRHLPGGPGGKTQSYSVGSRHPLARMA